MSEPHNHVSAESLDLKPCPFCGATKLSEEGNKGWPVVQCDDCGACGPCINLDRDKANATWNARITDDAQSAGMREQRRAERKERTGLDVEEALTLDDLPQCSAGNADKAREIVTDWLGMFDPPPQIDFQQSELLQGAIAAALGSVDIDALTGTADDQRGFGILDEPQAVEVPFANMQFMGGDKSEYAVIRADDWQRFTAALALSRPQSRGGK